MKAISADYIELQKLYRSKARQDVDQVLKIVRRLENNLKRSNAIDPKEIEAFCKGAGHVKLIRGRPLPIVEKDKPFDWSNCEKSIGRLQIHIHMQTRLIKPSDESEPRKLFDTTVHSSDGNGHVS